jgi:hypothetical protein
VFFTCLAVIYLPLQSSFTPKIATSVCAAYRPNDSNDQAGFAFGPIGRTGAADAMASSAGGNTAVSLSNSKGVYGGVTLDGAIVKVRHDINQKFYGTKPSVKDLMDGTVAPPPAARPLYDKLREYTELMVAKRNEPWPMGGQGSTHNGASADGGSTINSSFAATAGGGALQPRYVYGGAASSSPHSSSGSLSRQEQQQQQADDAAQQRFFEAQHRQHALNAAASVYNNTTPQQRQQIASATVTAASVAIASGAPDDVFV